TVSKKIIQNIKEKKLRDQEKFITSQDTIPNISSEIKIPYNQKVERGLISELLEFIRSNDATIPQNSYSISGKQIFDLFKKNMTYVGDLTIGTTPYLAHLFNKAEKTNELAKSQKLIGVNNCEHACNLLATESQISDSKTKILSETKISMPVKPQASDASSNLKTEA
ncbi:45004_t:CDS:2, partial [Gigaspora margarita]